MGWGSPNHRIPSKISKKAYNFYINKMRLLKMRTIDMKHNSKGVVGYVTEVVVWCHILKS